MDVNNNNRNSTRSMSKSHYGAEKLNKSTELNSRMSISPSEPDQYSRKIANVAGGNMVTLED